MPQPNDLSRSLVALDQDSTIIAVVELRQSSWLVGGVLPALSVNRVRSWSLAQNDCLACCEGERNPRDRAAGPDLLIPPAMLGTLEIRSRRCGLKFRSPGSGKSVGSFPRGQHPGCSAQYHHPMSDRQFATRWSMFATPSPPVRSSRSAARLQLPTRQQRPKCRRVSS